MSKSVYGGGMKQMVPMPSMIGSVNNGNVMMQKVPVPMTASRSMPATIGAMLPGNPFLKAPAKAYDPCYRPPGQARAMNYTAQDKWCAEKARAEREASKPFMPRAYDPRDKVMADRMAGLREAMGNLKRPEPTNTGAKPIDSHPRFGYQTMLPSVTAPLPTAPAVVGGNTNWTSLRSSPATQFLHSQLTLGRPMMPVDALGTFTRLAEPNVNSIHTTY